MTSLAQWPALSDSQRRVLLDGLLERLPDWLEPLELAAPTFVDRRHGDRWRLFPGGAVTLGATPERLAAVDALWAYRADLSWSPAVHLPVRPVRVRPFLLMEQPVRDAAGPRYFLNDVAGEVRRVLAERGVRLPSEAEWEFAWWAVRAAPDPWPADEWELCADGWRPNLEAVPDDGAPVPGEPSVLRQGSFRKEDVASCVPLRVPLASVRITCVRAALDVPGAT